MCIKGIKKCTFHMPHNADKWTMLKKSVLGTLSITYTAKIVLEHCNEMPSSWGSSAMLCHCTQDLCQALQQ